MNEATEKILKELNKPLRPTTAFKRHPEGWLSPDGKYFSSQWGYHENHARRLAKKFCPPTNAEELFRAGDWLLKRGWILVGSGVSYDRFIHWEAATQRQIDTVWDYCQALEIDMPELD